MPAWSTFFFTNCLSILSDLWPFSIGPEKACWIRLRIVYAKSFRETDTRPTFETPTCYLCKLGDEASRNVVFLGQQKQTDREKKEKKVCEKKQRAQKVGVSRKRDINFVQFSKNIQPSKSCPPFLRFRGKPFVVAEQSK